MTAARLAALPRLLDRLGDTFRRERTIGFHLHDSRLGDVVYAGAGNGRGMRVRGVEKQLLQVEIRQTLLYRLMHLVEQHVGNHHQVARHHDRRIQRTIALARFQGNHSWP